MISWDKGIVKESSLLLTLCFTGSFGILWFVCWCFMIAESPAKHSTITDTELDYIQSSIGYTEEQTEVIHVLCTQRQSKSSQIQVLLNLICCMHRTTNHFDISIVHMRYQCPRYRSSTVVLVIVNNWYMRNEKIIMISW